MDTKKDNYADNYNDKLSNRNSKDYELDNFDTDGTTASSPSANSSEKGNDASDYGDNFNSQIGETSDDLKYNLDDSLDEYYINTSPSERKNSGGRKSGKKSKRNAAIIFVCAAVVCIIAAIIFVLTQCSDGTARKTATTVASSSVKETEATIRQAAELQTETQPEQVETEAAVETEAPTEAVTEPQAVETEPVPTATEAPTQIEEPVQTVAGDDNSDINTDTDTNTDKNEENPLVEEVYPE